MDDRNNKNPFDGFFAGGTEENRNGRTDGAESKDEASRTGESRSYYYSYGPFRHGAGEEAGRSRETGGAYGQPEERPVETVGDVQVTPPSPVRPFAPVQQAPRSGWQVKQEKRRSSFKAMFASFLVGVVTVGGLMFAADYNNWFTAGSIAATQGPVAGDSTASGGGGNASTVADVVRPNNIDQIYKTASPAVVKIETYVQAQRGGSSMFDDPFFRQFFGDRFTQPDSQNDGQEVLNGIGSGFFFEKEGKTGYILTNQHVVGNADTIKVYVEGRAEPLEAELLGSSFELDLAVLKVEGDDFPTLPLGNSDEINIGEWVVAIGNPSGFDHTITVGVLSSKEREISISDQQGDRNYEHLLQTDASINPGNSGGPLLNLKGEVIGINTAVSSQAQGIGFAIPTSTINKVLDNLKNNTEIPKEPVPFIGVDLYQMNEQIAAELGIDEKTKGSLVRSVYYKTPAYEAGLRQFDIITGMDGTTYDVREDLIEAIGKKSVGDEVTLHIIRDGKKLDLKVKIGDKNKFPNLAQQQQQRQ
ncbi:trypsin-like peptidase domain-containing protein [Paenibacillus cisolokensis]|uniref:S1C family serine protease n=2 Tax=Paenibacillus TaxID=44249 RepID=UPI000722A565|nr:trypsin-like peptidase domain-containing protein [Paenibacillus sp. 32O-W]ALS26815.1 peptidase A2 [Paenibacillus sp. 32O-W]